MVAGQTKDLGLSVLRTCVDAQQPAGRQDPYLPSTDSSTRDTPATGPCILSPFPGFRYSLVVLAPCIRKASRTAWWQVGEAARPQEARTVRVVMDRISPTQPHNSAMCAVYLQVIFLYSFFLPLLYSLFVAEIHPLSWATAGNV